MYEQFGTYGAWLHPALGDASRIEYAPELEELGFQTIWAGIGSEPVGDMNLLEQMIAATRTAIIASAIVNMWRDDARSIAHHYHRTGIGLGHPESNRDGYQKPYERMVDYVNTLLEDRVPSEAIVIAALGAKTLKLAGQRTLGAHPYLTVPAHTRYARKVMGANVFLAPEHKVVLTRDVEEAHRIGRQPVRDPYLGLRNYTSNLMRHGFTEADVAGSGSDALVDALVAHGSPESIFERLNGHLAAGANHIGIQVVTGEHGGSPMRVFRRLARHRPA